MEPNTQSESPPRCKAILLRREAARLAFGLVDAGQGPAFADVPFPNLLDIETDLLRFAQRLGLTAPQVHAAFVERPDPRGALYYLIEETGVSVAGESARDAGTPPVEWLGAHDAAARLAGEDRLALARAIGFLSGQRFRVPAPS